MTANAASWVNVNRIDAPCCGSASINGLHFGAAVAAYLSPGFPQQIRALYVGAPGYAITSGNVVYPEAGTVFVFVPVNGVWQQLTYLQPFPPQAYAHFGAAIAVNNGIVMMGEPDYDSTTHVNAGRITLNHDRNRNALPYMPPAFNGLTSLEGAVDNGRFGASLAISGDGYETGGGENWWVVGAPGAGSGCAFLHHLGNTESIDRGSVCGASSGDAFGSSVGVYSFGASNMFMVVGAPGESTLTGVAHVYNLSGGNLAILSNLQAQNATQFDFFGTSVAIDSQRIYVGGTGRDKPGVGRTGSVTLFNPGGVNHYTFDTEVFPVVNANPCDLCGASVYPNAVGTGIAVGCPGSNAQPMAKVSRACSNPLPSSAVQPGSIRFCKWAAWRMASMTWDAAWLWSAITSMPVRRLPMISSALAMARCRFSDLTNCSNMVSMVECCDFEWSNG